MLIGHLTNIGQISTSDWSYPYLMLVLPRLTFTIISIISDVFVYKTAKLIGLKKKNSLWLYASSYVALVYYTRTLSNSIEAFLYTALFYVVCSQWKNAKASSEYTVSVKSDKCKDLVESNAKTSTYGTESFTSCGLVSLILVAGVFNRPTFVLFAIVPCPVWLFSDTVYNPSMKHIEWNIISKLLNCILCVLILVSVFTMCDSIYFGSLTIEDIINMKLLKMLLESPAKLMSKITITPLNFVYYNMQPKNLAEHGLHPRTQHLLVNTPLLFNSFALCIMTDAVKTVYAMWKYNKRCTFERKVDIFLLASYFVPIGLLSIFPHQEPRFLIPLLSSIMLYYRHMCHYRWHRVAIGVWLVTNLLCAGFYGNIHQSGVTQALTYCQQQGQVSQPNSSTTHIIMYHTYMPPKHLLSMTSDNMSVNGETNGIVLHDLMGNKIDNLLNHILKISSNHSSNDVSIKVIATATALENCDFEWKTEKIHFKQEKSFYPHVSTENLPQKDFLLCERDISVCNTGCRSLDFLQRFRFLFSLNIYHVKVS